MTWYEVTAVVKVEAKGKRHALNMVAHSLTKTNIPGVHPVAAFKVEPCEDPDETTHVHLPR